MYGAGPAVALLGGIGGLGPLMFDGQTGSAHASFRCLGHLSLWRGVSRVAVTLTWLSRFLRA